MGAKERAEAEERQRQRQRQDVEDLNDHWAAMEANLRAEAEERQRQRQRQSGYRLPETQGALRVYGTARENFAEAQKWRGISAFGEVPGGQRPNNNNALHYFNAALSIDPAHEAAISHRAICLWDLGKRHEAVGVLNIALAKNQCPTHSETVRGWLKEMYSKV